MDETENEKQRGLQFGVRHRHQQLSSLRVPLTDNVNVAIAIHVRDTDGHDYARQRRQSVHRERWRTAAVVQKVHDCVGTYGSSNICGVYTTATPIYLTRQGHQTGRDVNGGA